MKINLAVSVMPLQMMSICTVATTSSRQEDVSVTLISLIFYPYLGVNYYNLYWLTLLEIIPSFCKIFHWYFSFCIVYTYKEDLLHNQVARPNAFQLKKVPFQVPVNICWMLEMATSSYMCTFDAVSWSSWVKLWETLQLLSGDCGTKHVSYHTTYHPWTHEGTISIRNFTFNYLLYACYSVYTQKSMTETQWHWFAIFDSASGHIKQCFKPKR